MSDESTMHIRFRVTDDERKMICRAAAQAECRSVSEWAALSLIDLARVETSAAASGEGKSGAVGGGGQ